MHRKKIELSGKDQSTVMMRWSVLSTETAVGRGRHLAQNWEETGGLGQQCLE